MKHVYLKPIFNVLLISIILLSGCAKKTPGQKLEEAVNAFKKQDMLGAIIKFKNLIKENPNSQEAAQARLFLGRCYEMQGDFEEALANYEAVIKKVSLGDTKGQQAFSMKMNIYINQQKHDEAIKEMESVIKAIPEGSQYQKDLKFNLGIIYLDKKDYENAMKLLEPFLYDEKDAQVNQQAINMITQSYMRDKEFKKAIEFIDKFLEKKPDVQFKNLLNITKGYFYSLDKDDANAEKFFKEGEDGYKKDIEDTLDAKEKISIKFELARAYELRDKFEEANALYDSVIKESQDENAVLTSYFSKNTNLIRLKDLDGALKMLDDIERQFPTIPSAVSEVQQRRADIKRLKEMPEDRATTPTLESAAPKDDKAKEAPVADKEAKEDSKPKKESEKKSGSKKKDAAKK